MQAELAFVQPAPQSPSQGGTGFNRKLHGRVEEADSIAARPFCLIEGKVGLFQQGLRRVSLAAKKRQTDAGGVEVLGFAAAQHIRQIDGEADFFGNDLRVRRRELFRFAQPFQQNHILIPAQAGNGVPLPHAGREPLGDLEQHAIADIMALRIVNALEMVQVQDHQCAEFPAAVAGSHGMPQAIQHQAPVGQTRQRIEVGQVADLILGAPAVGDVLDEGNTAFFPAKIAVKRNAGQRHPDAGFVVAQYEFALVRALFPVDGSPQCRHEALIPERLHIEAEQFFPFNLEYSRDAIVAISDDQILVVVQDADG